MFYDIYATLCKEKGLSPSKAAENISLNRTAVVKWKKGAVPSGSTLKKIADYFNVTVDYLMGETKNEDNTSYVLFEKLLMEHDTTIEQIAEEIGISKATLNDWSLGKNAPAFDKLQKIADYFEVSVDYLLGKSESKALTKPKTLPSDVDIKFALFHGEEGVTDEMYNEVMRYAQFLIEKEKEKQQEK